MNEKDFIALLDEATYFGAFSMLSPELENAFRECVQKLKPILKKYGDTFSEEAQEWALKLLMRESIDDYIHLVVNDLFIHSFSRDVD